MRILALDIGERRVGVALSDPDGLLASPLTVLETRDPTWSEKVDQLVKDHGVGLVLVGLPLTMGGEEGPQAGSVRTVAEDLARSLSVPVEYHDERLSTVTAHRARRETGKCSSRDARGEVDKMAAAVFLQSFLDSGRAHGGRGCGTEENSDKGA